MPFNSDQPSWWKQAVRETLGAAPVKAPLWPDLAKLPPLILGGEALTESQVGELLIALRKSSVIVPLSLVREVKQRLDPAALERFAWRLFELCLAKGEAPEIKWGLGAVGLLGGDASALKLTPFLREWPGQGFSQRAALGLESLRAIGTDTAMMQLNGIAQKVKFKALQGKARKFMGEIAHERGLNAQQLEDRIVPDLGLDQRGSRIFDFGPRQFRLVFGPNLKPLLRDEQGKVKSGLPKAGAKDDPGKVAEAVRDWQLLKKQVSETVKVQAKRLERAMLTRRRWPVSEFATFVVGHPFLVHMARVLLWGDYDADRRLLATFRVTEDGTFADVNDGNYVLRGSAVGLVHPLNLPEAERAKWGEVFGDYELIPPFPQLGRRIHLLEPGEEGKTELTRFSGPSIPDIVFAGILKQQSWMPSRRTGFHGYYKRFPEADVTALMQIEYAHGAGVSIKRVFFVPGFPEDGGLDEAGALRLGEVEPVTRSEVLGIVTVLASKGTPAP